VKNVKTVVFDPGHGGRDPGASAFGEKEKDLALKIALKTAGYLLKRYSNVKAVLTRNDDTYVELEDRVSLSNRLSASAFVSIHLNAGPQSASGFEILTYPNSSSAAMLASEISKRLQKIMKSRGVKGRPDLYVLKHTRCPAVLVEVGFITSRSDLDTIKKNIEGIAGAIADGVAAYLRLPLKKKELYRVVLRTGTYETKEAAEKARTVIEEVAKKVAKVYKIDVVKE
jgi:N-acetylmuramoyl-L-alanine amidase